MHRVPARGEEDERRTTPEASLPPAGRSPLPIFIFPPSLDFYADEQASHKQVLTLYNPFPRVLRYKVLSTAPLRYTVVDAEGLVKPNSCIDIVTRHRDIRARHYGSRDKFRVEIWEEGGGGRGVGGRKDIPVTLHPTRPQSRERAISEAPQWHPPSQVFSVRRGVPPPLSPGLFGLYVLVGLVSLVVLMLPLHGDPRSVLHENLHVSVVQKLVAAYVLGLLTMVFLQS
ncbi:PREDICTED: motile sperm domain-containing protein 1-like [Nanorana parkeri]|uniref:motile sperm domain-containing protein 1-like n=1 Tax=Nanorana parkeri TaxID=125878 RepID=UPI0008541BB3|nr:PREDICTED: motile sperm domain-containing protein 1-like [Nanorana parkeri]